MDNEKIPKNPLKFSCDNCDYTTSNKKDFKKHLSTDKHSRITDNNEKSPNVGKIPTTYDCLCGKSYKYSSGLSAHRKKCKENSMALVEVKEDKEDLTMKDMLLEMINQNKELQKTIIEQNKTIQEQNKTIQEIAPKIGNNNSNNTNNIIVNNLTLLNSNCKDAISINDFIDSIQIEMKHLLHTSDKGLINGITNIFLENYNKLPLQKRPLWCGDKKRKKLYIKEEEWHEDKDNQKTKEAIKSLTAKQAKNTGKYTKENPDWMQHDKKKDKFLHMVNQTTQEMDDEKQSNIINNLLDVVHLTENVKSSLQK